VGVKKGRGRVSHLSKAHNRALIDIASKKQRHIFGALRAGNAPKGVSPMKILSFNYRGVVSPLKKSTLKWLIFVNQA
jgi:hypothetical protein